MFAKNLSVPAGNPLAVGSRSANPTGASVRRDAWRGWCFCGRGHRNLPHSAERAVIVPRKPRRTTQRKGVKVK